MVPGPICFLNSTRSHRFRDWFRSNDGRQRGAIAGRGTSCPKIIHRNIANEQSQRLKSALWFSIGKIVDEETIKLGVNATPQFIGALTEMVWAQIGMPKSLVNTFCVKELALTDVVKQENVSADLESFAK